MDVSDPLQVAASAAQGFQLLQCEECAKRIRKALIAAGHVGQEIEVRGGTNKPFMICFSYDGGKAAISRNGRHVAIRVGDVVFDNLHSNGMVYADWLQDYDAPGGIIVFRIDDF